QNGTPLDSADIYDPKTGVFTASANAMSDPRQSACAVALDDGTVLVGAGFRELFAKPANSADIFDPATNRFAPTTPLHIARAVGAGVRLDDGRPLFLGGADDQAQRTNNFQPSGELYDPGARTFTVTGGLNELRVAGAAARLVDGTVLIAGGVDGAGEISKTAEIYDPATDRFTLTEGQMNKPRVSSNAITLGVSLKDGKVLIAGGS